MSPACTRHSPIFLRTVSRSPKWNWPSAFRVFGHPPVEAAKSVTCACAERRLMTVRLNRRTTIRSHESAIMLDDRAQPIAIRAGTQRASGAYRPVPRAAGRTDRQRAVAVFPFAGVETAESDSNIASGRADAPAAGARRRATATSIRAATSIGELRQAAGNARPRDRRSCSGWSTSSSAPRSTSSRWTNRSAPRRSRGRLSPRSSGASSFDLLAAYAERLPSEIRQATGAHRSADDACTRGRCSWRRSRRKSSAPSASAIRSR